MDMCVSRVLGMTILATCLILTLGSPRVRRQVTGFTVIGNETLPCTTMTELYGSDAPVDMTDEEKMELFKQYGGKFLSAYMATSGEEAMNTFTSPIPLEKRFRERIELSRSSNGLSPTNKRVIADYMMNHVYNGFSDADMKQDAQSSFLPSKTKKQQLFREMLEGMRGEKDIQKRRHVWRAWSKQNGADEDLPLMFPEMLGLPKTTRNSDNSVSTNEYCLVRGDYTSPDQEHVRLCTLCSSTTAFGPHMWPQYVNEAHCMVGDDGCLFTDTLANGSCQQVMMSLNMLQKNSDVCVMVLRDGQHVVAYEWAFVTRDIGVGCECNVKSGSYFVNFV